MSIAPDVLAALEKSGAFSPLDDLMAREDELAGAEPCQGDFRLLKRVLAEKGFGKHGEIDEIFDICHVMMFHGAFCDCEVLFNVVETSRLKSRYWIKRAKEVQKADGFNV